MKILLVEHYTSADTKWNDIVSLIFPLAKLTICSIDTWISFQEKEIADFVLLLSDGVYDDLLELASHYIQLKDPVLCVIDNYSESDYHLLVNQKLNGLIQRDTTSVKAIKEIMELLLDGGYYLQAPVKMLR